VDPDVPALGCTVSAALAGVGAGSVNNGAHSYKIVVNKTGGTHTLPSAASAPLTVVNHSTNGKVDVARTGGTLPTGDTWDVYRTAGNADPTKDSNFKLVNPSPLSASTTTYQDNIADGSLGAVAPTTSTAGTNPENVAVTGVGAGTFTATFTLAHYANWLLAAPNPQRWTDLSDHDIEWDGYTWVSQPIIPGAVSNQPDGASASFKIADGDDALFPVIAACNGAELSPAAIYEAGFLSTNKTATPDEVLEIFTGRVDRATVDSDQEDSVEFILMPPAAQDTMSLPTRLISSLVRA